MDKTGTLIHDFKTGNHLTDLQLCSRRRSLWEHQDGGRLRHRNYILRTFLSIFFNPHLRTCSCKNFFADVELKPKNRTFKKKKDFCSKTTTTTFFSNWTRFTSFFSFQNFNRSEISLVFFFFRFTRFTLLCFQRFNSRLIRSNETEARPEKNQTATLPSGFVLKLFDEYKIITVVKQQHTR